MLTPDGFYRIALSDHAATIVYRAYMIAEVCANRGRRAKRDDYTESAYEFACILTKGQGICPCSDADHDSWSKATQWVVMDGDAKEPRGQWARTIWRGRAAAHGVYAVVGLVVRARGTWYPQATMLFRTPKAPPPPEEKRLLTNAEADALANQRWSLDFLSDALIDGRRFRILAVLDDFTRECLALVADTSLSGQRVVRELDAIIVGRGRPARFAATTEPLRWAQHFATLTIS